MGHLDLVARAQRVEALARAGQLPDGREVRHGELQAPEDPVQGTSSMHQAAAAQRAMADVAVMDEDAPVVGEVQAPIVKSDFEKTPRNAPCPCGSGKKFKLCHGR